MFEFGFLRHLLCEFSIPLATHLLYLVATTWLNFYRLHLVCGRLELSWWDQPQVGPGTILWLTDDSVQVYGSLAQKTLAVVYYEESIRAAFRLASPWFFSREALVRALRLCRLGTSLQWK